MAKLRLSVEFEVDDLDGSLTRAEATELGVLRVLRRIVLGTVMMVSIGGSSDHYELCASEGDRTIGEVTVDPRKEPLRLAS